MHTGQIIRAAREKRGLSRRRLAERLGVSVTVMQRFESGESCTTRTLEKIASALSAELSISFGTSSWADIWKVLDEACVNGEHGLALTQVKDIALRELQARQEHNDARTDG